MTKQQQTRSLADTGKVAPAPSQQHQRLVDASSAMIINVSESTSISTLLRSKAEKSRQAKLKVALLEESARVAEAQLAKAQELIRLGTDMAEQQYIDSLRVEFQDTVGSMARQAENDLRAGVISLFSAKVGILESLDKLAADADLKQIAAEVVSRLTDASAEQLIRNNTKPR